MIQYTKQIIVLSAIFQLIVSTIYAQNGAASAYTSFGVGRIENSATIKNQGMGGTGIALPSQYSVNSLNPASLSGIESEQMLIDIGLKLNYTSYEHNTESGGGFSGGLNNLILAFKSGKKLFTSISLTQYSSVGYNILSSAYIEGTDIPVSKSYEGTGGLNEFALANSYAANKNFSLGLKLSYLFGQLKKNEFYSATDIGGDLNVDYSDYLQQFDVETGFQYKIPLANSNLFIGGIYSPQIKFKTTREVTTSSSSGAGIFEEVDSDDYEIASNIAGGLAWTNVHGIKVALDYHFQNWDEIEYGNALAEYKDSHRFSGGMEFRRRKSRRVNPYLWQLGGYYEDSYIKVKGKTILDRGITCGVGIPMNTKNSYLNISLNYGKRGTASNTLINEDYYKVSVSMSMMEGWFRKIKFD